MKPYTIIYKFLVIVKSFINYFYNPTVLGVQALIIKNNKILLVKHTYISGWYTPGGGVKAGETTGNAIKREVAEEVHLIMHEEPKLQNIFYAKMHNAHDYIVLYLCTNFKEKTGHCSKEIKEKKWFSLDNLPQDISHATKQRIDEYLGKAIYNGKW